MTIFLALILVAAGVCLGYLLCALLVMAKQADRIANKAEQLADKIDWRNSHEPPEEPPPDLPGH